MGSIRIIIGHYNTVGSIQVLSTRPPVTETKKQSPNTGARANNTLCTELGCPTVLP